MLTNPMVQNHCAPSWSFPRLNTQSYMMLTLLLTGEVIAETEICRIFGHNYRSVIQSLGGRRYCWRIENVLDAKGDIAGRKLDPRHLSGVPYQDIKARLERAVELKKKSANQAFREKRRAVKAGAELDIAIERLEAFNAHREESPEDSPEA
ncbi:hypothetical protein [Aeromonas veronii]|uniref:hypothetical protein n=1 Tax=Aeromonas veronii TaxID=654 RepID=UPI003D24BC3D